MYFGFVVIYIVQKSHKSHDVKLSETKSLTGKLAVMQWFREVEECRSDRMCQNR